jgi:hypothetical protein
MDNNSCDIVDSLESSEKSDQDKRFFTLDCLECNQKFYNYFELEEYIDKNSSFDGSYYIFKLKQMVGKRKQTISIEMTSLDSVASTVYSNYIMISI